MSFPGLCKGLLRLPLYSPDSRRGSGPAQGARRRTAIQPSTVARIWHRQRQKPWAGDLAAHARPSSVRRAAPRSSRGAPARRQARRAAPRRNRAPERHNAPVGPVPDRHRRLSAPSPRAKPDVSDARLWPTRSAPGSGSDRLGRPARLGFLQMRQQSLAEMALQEGRVVTRWQESRTGEAGIAQVAG